VIKPLPHLFDDMCQDRLYTKFVFKQLDMTTNLTNFILFLSIVAYNIVNVVLIGNFSKDSN
jgi:hypothetical protein